METLASIFVGLVIAAHSILPQANLPQVLGVETENSSPSAASVRRNEILEKARMERKQLLENARLRKSQIQERVKDERLEFKERLANLKDERKKEIVAKVDDRLNSLNEKWVSHWNSVLTRLTEILAKIESRAARLAASGKDITSVTTSIASAKVAIQTAQTAVNTQGDKNYVITITSEETLRSDVQKVVEQFKFDAAAVREVITKARQAVIQTFRALAAITGEKIEENI